jgi:hypothetical protein
MSKLILKCVGFKPLRRNTLVGFATIRIADMRLKITDVGIHEKGTARWAALPAKPKLRDGGLVRDDAGKGQYVQFPVFPCKPDKAPCTERERKARPEAIYSKLGGCA